MKSKVVSGCIYGDPKCIVDRRYQCDQTSKVYKITCIECNSVIDDTTPEKESLNYVGKTRTSIHARMSNHLDGQRRKSNSNPLHTQDAAQHDGHLKQYTCVPDTSDTSY